MFHTFHLSSWRRFVRYLDNCPELIRVSSLLQSCQYNFYTDTLHAFESWKRSIIYPHDRAEQLILLISAPAELLIKCLRRYTSCILFLKAFRKYSKAPPVTSFYSKRRLPDLTYLEKITFWEEKLQLRLQFKTAPSVSCKLHSWTICQQNICTNNALYVFWHRSEREGRIPHG